MNPISLASGVVPECGPIQTIRAAEEGGFEAVGLWIEPSRWTSQLLHDARGALAGSGLELLDVEVIWLKPGSDLDEHRRCIDIGAALGARNVLCVSSDPDMAATAARLAQLCTHAEGSGMRVALEFGVFTEVKTIGMARSVLDQVAHPLGALLIDPIHIDRSGGSVAEIAALPPGLLPYAQFCDAPAERPDPRNFEAVIHDALDLRRHPGDGALPLSAIFHALPAGIPLSIELRSKALRDEYPDPGRRALATARAARAWLRDEERMQ